MKHLILLAALLVSTSAFASENQPNERTPTEDRSVLEIQPGSTLTAARDIFLFARQSNVALAGTKGSLPFSVCYLQAFEHSSVDRVVRAGRVLRIWDVVVTDNYVVLKLDDGRKDRVIAQVGCTLDARYRRTIPLIGDVTRTLANDFTAEIIESPVEEVSVQF